MSIAAAPPVEAFVEETRFGKWFLHTTTWKMHVLHPALADLKRLLPARQCRDRILDVGCGFGHSFDVLAEYLEPKMIVGMDAEPDLQQHAGAQAKACRVPVTLCAGNASKITWPDNNFDVVFCHQTFHHLVAQHEALAEFRRVLKPGGVLLFAESTKKYIDSLPIRILFRHPMNVQRTAEEYVAMIRRAGFELPDNRISFPYLWWSRTDLGLRERIGLREPCPREETLVNAVALKP